MSKRQYIGHTIMTLCSQSIFYASVPSRVPGSQKKCARMKLKQKFVLESIKVRSREYTGEDDIKSKVF